MPMAILVDIGGWKIEATDTNPALLVAINLQGRRRPLNRVDALHYLCHDDFMACLSDAYKKGGRSWEGSSISLEEVRGKPQNWRQWFVGIIIGERGFLMW
eukprot:3389705-Amphidinium_carterae.1